MNIIQIRYGTNTTLCDTYIVESSTIFIIKMYNYID